MKQTILKPIGTALSAILLSTAATAQTSVINSPSFVEMPTEAIALTAATETSGSFYVAGNANTYYIVTFIDGGWNTNEATELEIGRSAMNLDGASSGSLIAKFRYHVDNYYSGAGFIEANIRQTSTVKGPFIADWKDVSTDNASASIAIWLRGATTYYYKANVTTVPVVRDGVSNPVNYKPGATTFTSKTTVDTYVNGNGLINPYTAYFLGGGVNYFGGSVGIGTTTPGSYKLAVKGSIGAMRVKVSQAEWADFVFEPGYKLPSLQELERYIKTNKHLPDVPSAKEVTSEGLDLGEMNKILLQKIEELTLHLIQQERTNTEQAARITRLEEIAKKSSEK